MGDRSFLVTLWALPEPTEPNTPPSLLWLHEVGRLDWGIEPVLAGDADTDGNLDLLMRFQSFSSPRIWYEQLGASMVPSVVIEDGTQDRCD